MAPQPGPACRSQQVPPARHVQAPPTSSPFGHRPTVSPGQASADVPESASRHRRLIAVRTAVAAAEVHKEAAAGVRLQPPAWTRALGRCIVVSSLKRSVEEKWWYCLQPAKSIVHCAKVP